MAEQTILDEQSFAELIRETLKEYAEIMPEAWAMRAVCEQFLITETRARELLALFDHEVTA